jgi:hypothetical protein
LQTDFIRQQGPFRKRRIKSEERRVDLMRVQIDLRACDRSSEFLQAIGGAALRQLKGIVLGVIWSEIHFSR